MDYRKEFERMMQSQTEIALATSGTDCPMSALSIFIMTKIRRRCTSQVLGTIKKLRSWSNILMLRLPLSLTTMKSTFV